MNSKLSKQINEWTRIEASSDVLDWIKHGVRFSFCEEIDSFELTHKWFSKKSFCDLKFQNWFYWTILQLVQFDHIVYHQSVVFLKNLEVID